jgi:hypothetical protein
MMIFVGFFFVATMEETELIRWLYTAKIYVKVMFEIALFFGFVVPLHARQICVNGPNSRNRELIFGTENSGAKLQNGVF